MFRKPSWLFRHKQTEPDPGERPVGWRISEYANEPWVDELPEYHYVTRYNGLKWEATVVEFPELITHGENPDNAKNELIYRVKLFVTEQTVKGLPIPVPIQTKFTSSFVNQLYTSTETRPTFKEPFSNRLRVWWYRSFHANKPELYRPHAPSLTFTKRTILSATGWLSTAIFTCLILWGQAHVQWDRPHNFYQPMLSASDLIFYSNPIPVENVKKGDLIRITRTDRLVEFGYFHENRKEEEVENTFDTITVTVPAFEKPSLVMVDEIRPVTRIVPYLGYVFPFLQSPFAALVPFILFACGFFWVNRQKQHMNQEVHDA